MEIITNLEDAKNITIGKSFIYGKYQGDPVEWRKINETLAISENVLDCVLCDTKSEITYDESKLCRWCNKILGNSLGLSDDKIYILSYDEMLKYFPSNESRQAKPTEWAIIHGVYVDEEGYSSYWTSSPTSCWYGNVRIVYSSGLFGYNWYGTDNSYVGVRPALKLG